MTKRRKTKEEILKKDPWDVKKWNKKGSPYWAWAGEGKSDDAGRVPEPIKANPDSLEKGEGAWDTYLTVQQRKRLEAIQDSFDILTDLEKRIISLIYIEGMSQIEISLALGITQQRVSFAMKDLKQKIKSVYKEKKGV